LALACLSFHLDRADFREAAVKAITAYGKMIARYPRAFAKSLAVVDFLLEGPVELALVGQPGETGLEALRRAIAGHYLPNRIIAHHDPTAGDPPAFPLLAGKGLVRGKAALYVCRNFACQAPITDPSEVSAVLGAIAKNPVVGERTLSGTHRPGRATPGGTTSYAARFVAEFGAGAYAQLGSTGLTVSRVGFGGYRVHDETPEHSDALRRALLSGANLIDTSTNYTDGGSERLVGAVVNELVGSEKLRREEIVVVSKIGYVQGSNLSLAQDREAAGRPFPEMVKYMDGCWHCLHPEFLQDQLDRSLARLGLQTLDVCLLHNPEYFFSDAKRRGLGSLAALRDEFYRRMMEAFRFFEGQVAAGTIRWYGVSSNTATAPAADPEATSLTRMLLAAREAGGADHHFRVLQLPMNLFEAGGVLEHNNGPENRETVLECASREGIGVLVNRPLNAIVGEGMLRLADFPVGTGAVRFDAQLRVVAELEAEYRGQIAPNIRVSPGSSSPEEFFRWAEQLDGVQARLQSLEHWQQIEGQMIVPSVTQVVRGLDGGLGGEVAERWRTWRDRYLPELRLLLAELRRQAAQKSQALSRAVGAAVDPLLPTERSGETLSRKALWVVASTPGVGSVLNGIRTPAYVDDTLGILRWPPLASVLPVYEVIHGLQLTRR
jgi:uncharacterized protein